MEHSRLKFFMNATSLVLFVLCVLLGIWLWRQGVFQSKEALQEFLNNYAGSAATIFLALQAVQVVIPILPGGVSCLAGVLIFGPWLGFVLNYVGIALGSFVAFAMARNWGKPLLNKIFSRKLHEKYERWTHESRRFDRLFAIAIFLPGLPDDFLCFLAGTTGMSWKKFALITITCRPLMIFVYSLGALGFRAVFPL